MKIILMGLISLILSACNINIDINTEPSDEDTLVINSSEFDNGFSVNVGESINAKLYIANTENITFDVTNLPTWLEFDAATSTVSGIPTESDVGLYENISISVTNGEQIVVVGPFSIEVVMAAYDATIYWEPVTHFEDGALLTNFSHYNISWVRDGESATQSENIYNQLSDNAVITGLRTGSYSFSMKTVLASGIESEVSNIQVVEVLGN